MNVRESTLNALPVGLMYWLLDNHISQLKKSEQRPDAAIVAMKRRFEQRTMDIIWQNNKIKRNAIREQYNGIMKQINKYMLKNFKTQPQKSLMVAIEWIYALHEADAIDIGEMGYGDDLNALDDVFQEHFIEGTSGGDLFQKSINKHVKKIHKLTSKLITI